MPKQELIDEIVAQVQVCRKCRLWQHARNPVPGEGNLDASLMLIGEAPGNQEDIKGRPFVGSAGKLLNTLISVTGLKREDVYICNIVKHRPPENREPRADEIKACTSYLDRQIHIIKPNIIATLGKHSTKYILSKVGVEVNGLAQVRGRIYTERLLDIPVRIIPTYHPAAVLYNPSFRQRLKEDFQKIKKELEESV
ncbi:type-4 uracil-DNA glycosylase [Candidatus Methanoperedens nitratireducens]|uniref:Type-4 uracil-DNA glycosylase n=1 Tax=Candidatus Methanoperedens nitratireducens TaxID=1392998 RepID=A0A284VRA4_9EURY|nr:type-4 uracil-DNA glycosylase [Candidatus Methanoperedens nitroreducens]SNQ61815.1 Uracil DNA glycosylase superfamily protein [Candidatus Methanoperedens nitroreducens]